MKDKDIVFPHHGFILGQEVWSQCIVKVWFFLRFPENFLFSLIC